VKCESDLALVGFKEEDLFYSVSIAVERQYLANIKAMTEVLRWKSEARNRLKILIIHDDSLGYIRLARKHRYYTKHPEVPQTVIDENLFDRDQYEVYQLFTRVDLSNNCKLGKLLKYVERIAQEPNGLGKRYFVVLVNQFHWLFDINRHQPAKEYVNRDYVSNIMAHSLEMIRYHLKQQTVFAGFNTRVLTQLCVDVMDLLRRKNPSFGYDQIYWSDVVSPLASVVANPKLLEQWDRSRLFLMRNLILAMMKQHELPFIPSPIRPNNRSNAKPKPKMSEYRRR
jgi:hypothetical protein